MKVICAAILVAVVFLTSCGVMPPPPSRPHNPRHPVSSQRYPSKPELKRLKNGHYRVMRPWTVEVGGRWWTIQKGYTCNGITASDKIKKSLGDGVQHPETWAAVYHDWLFTQPGVSRQLADQLFYELLIAYGVPPLEAQAMYSWVAAYSLSKAVR